MRKSYLAGLSLLTFCALSHAQSSVTLYGLIDAGLTFSNNQAGSSSLQAQSGIILPSRWGILGSEDIGGGNRIIFRLESGFDVMRGTLGQGGREFGRGAYVGIASQRFGTLTIGRQNDFIADYLAPFAAVSQGGILFPHAGDVDNTGINFRINNAVKFQSHPIKGVQFGGLYSFGGVPGSFSANSVVSLGIKYDGAPFSAAAGYLHIKTPFTTVPEGLWTPTNTVDGNYGIAAETMDVMAVGGRYTIGKAALALMYSNTRFGSLNPALGDKIGGDVVFQVVDINGSYQVTPPLKLAMGYSYTFGNVHATGKQPKYHEVNAIADYFLSKRTDVYVEAVYQRAAGDAQFANLAPVISASSNKSQLVARIGLRHAF